MFEYMSYEIVFGTVPLRQRMFCGDRAGEGIGDGFED